MENKIKFLSNYFNIHEQEFERIVSIIGEVDDVDLMLSIFGVVKDISKESTNRLYYLIKRIFEFKVSSETTEDALMSVMGVNSLRDSYKQEVISLRFGRHNLILGRMVAENIDEIMSVKLKLKDIT